MCHTCDLLWQQIKLLLVTDFIKNFSQRDVCMSTLYFMFFQFYVWYDCWYKVMYIFFFDIMQTLLSLISDDINFDRELKRMNNEVVLKYLMNSVVKTRKKQLVQLFLCFLNIIICSGWFY